jgi:hypothetical protein
MFRSKLRGEGGAKRRSRSAPVHDLKAAVCIVDHTGCFGQPWQGAGCTQGGSLGHRVGAGGNGNGRIPFVGHALAFHPQTQTIIRIIGFIAARHVIARHIHALPRRITGPPCGDIHRRFEPCQGGWRHVPQRLNFAGGGILVQCRNGRARLVIGIERGAAGQDQQTGQDGDDQAFHATTLPGFAAQSNAIHSCLGQRHTF